MTRWIALVTCLCLCAPLPVGAVSKPAAGAKQADAIAEEAKRRFREGEFAIALGLFEKAFDLDHRADRMYNMARCHEKLGDLAKAVDFFERYAAATDDVAGAAEAKVRVGELRRQMAAKAAEDAKRQAEAEARARAEEAQKAAAAAEAKRQADAAALAAAPTPTERPVQARQEGTVLGNWGAGHWLAAGGAGVLTAGVAVWAVGAAADSALNRKLGQVDGKGHVAGITETDATAGAASNGRWRTAGVALAAVGTVAAAVGGWLWFDSAPIAPVVGPAHVGAVVRF